MHFCLYNTFYLVLFFLFQQHYYKDPENQTMTTVLFEHHCLYGNVIFISAKLLKRPFSQTMNTVLFEQHCLYIYVIFISAKLLKGPCKSDNEYSYV